LRDTHSRSAFNRSIRSDVRPAVSGQARNHAEKTAYTVTGRGVGHTHTHSHTHTHTHTHICIYVSTYTAPSSAIRNGDGGGSQNRGSGNHTTSSQTPAAAAASASFTTALRQAYNGGVKVQKRRTGTNMTYTEMAASREGKS
jgi:hypothetical protein